MAEKQVTLTDDGQEVQQADYNLLGATAGLADDRTLAEFLRLQPYDGTNVYKAILPYSNRANAGTGPSTAPVVAPTGSANGSVQVNPFRAAVGSRNAANAAPSPNPTNDADAAAAWRDIRSAVFVGGTTNIAETIALAANSSGNPRWDLVYAQVSVDVGQNSVVRRVKDPAVGTISNPSVPQYTGSPVVVLVVTGTPGSSPALPVLPADAAGNYCIPLAWVRVPNGFSSGSTVLTQDVRSCVLGHDGSSPVSDFRALHSGFESAPATGNNDTTGTYATRAFPWSATLEQRPGPFLPPDMVGGKQVFCELDLTAGSSSGWSHNSGDIVDDSIDWRNRFLIPFCSGDTAHFANDPQAGSTTRMPNAISATDVNTNFYIANSFAADASVIAGGATISVQKPANNGAMASGAQVALYVNMTDGTLRVNIGATAPGCRLFFWLMASAPFPNM